MIEDYVRMRGDTKNFFCPNRLWDEVKKKTKDCTSISFYVRQAILEKLIRDEPEKKEYFESLVS